MSIIVGSDSVVIVDREKQQMTVATTTTVSTVRNLSSGIWAVESASEPGTERLVKLSMNGQLTCDCPHGFFHADDIASGRRKPCRHVAAVVAVVNEQQYRTFGLKDSDFLARPARQIPPVELGLALLGFKG
jgi:hypothetical protein